MPYTKGFIMFKLKSQLILSICLITLSSSSCSQDDKKVSVAEPIAQSSFNAEVAQENLAFVKNQYLKLIHNIDNNHNVLARSGCEESGIACIPRSEEHGKIYLDTPRAWTNGYFPGLLWMLLNSKENINQFDASEVKTLEKTAIYYQSLLHDDALRTDTHDLGFIIYDSFGEALNYIDLPNDLKTLYQSSIETARNSLATRFDPSKGVIKSWDWIGNPDIQFMDGDQITTKRFRLENPNKFPVIIDNMMNLELLFTSANPEHHKIAFLHAQNTHNNHYFYQAEDTERQFPISYHLVNYNTMKPGNWQGLGAISAWSRGQAWSLYGFTTVSEAIQEIGAPSPDYPNITTHMDKLYNSVSKLLGEQYVPYWDFFVERSDAHDIASNTGEDTTPFSRILNLCDNLVADDVLPYVGFKPIAFDAKLLNEESQVELAKLTSIYKEPLIKDGRVFSCGTQDFDLSNRTIIPKDSSAAAIMASALYRYAYFLNDKASTGHLVELADNIMLQLTNHFRTDKDPAGKNSFDLGFALTQATGSQASPFEVNVPIVYSDFYFVEANMRKLELEKQQAL